MGKTDPRMEFIEIALSRGPRRPEELARDIGLNVATVNKIIKESGKPYRLVEGMWRRIDGKRYVRQRGEPLLRRVETNGIGGSSAFPC